MAVEQFAAALEALLQAMGFSGRRQRQLQRRRPQRTRKGLQCYNCQQLGHTARECTNAVACLKCAAAHDTRCCTKPRGVAGRCANCGGSHAANSRSCGYLRASRRLSAAPRPAAASSATPAAPPSRSGEGCEPRRLEAATDHALAGFQAAFAAERAALKAELAAVHRQLQRLRDELRAIKKTSAVPAAAPPVPRPVGVDAATQTSVAPSPVATQVVAPMDTDDVPPRTSQSITPSASHRAVATTDSSPVEQSLVTRLQHPTQPSAVPAAAPPVSRPVGVAAATQASAASSPAAAPMVAPMDTDNVPSPSSRSVPPSASQRSATPTASSRVEPIVRELRPPQFPATAMDTAGTPPQSSHSVPTSASQRAVTPTTSSRVEPSIVARLRQPKFPASHELQPFLKGLAVSLQDGSYPFFDHPYPYSLSSVRPPLPHHPHRFSPHQLRWLNFLTKKELTLLNKHPIFSPSEWQLLADLTETHVTGLLPSHVLQSLQ
ncbi:uncharacterized protein LOC126232428 [Schistocerca nitens]|uniref:uncharacterized protein LOC126232428 n=1 Tax=Schistocerca nitens TaxID=7011 RepID=UPI0021192FC0|nr:uncharacterized protein LOC126232428 [Schistocerca nitens]